MITTKRNELEVINSFNDLIKDTKEKQRINKLVKQYSNDYFMEKLSESELKDNVEVLDELQELSSHYQKYAYIIARRIKADIIDEYCIDEEYYDGSFDSNGFQVVKKRRVIDTRKAGQNFEEDLEEELNNLVVEDYFKNLNKTLEIYNFNNKLGKIKETQSKRTIKNNSNKIENIIYNELKETYNYYKEKGNSNYTIVRNFKTNKEVIDYLYNNILGSIKTELDIEVNKDNIKAMFNEELRRFLQAIDTRNDEEESKIPMGWKFYAATKFIDNLFK
jgi:hypothetical protein